MSHLQSFPAFSLNFTFYLYKIYIISSEFCICNSESDQSTKDKIMKQKLSVFSLLILSFVLLFLCFGFRRIASDTPEAREVYSRAAYDTYAEDIFASRESFPGLIVSIQADNDTLYGEENGLLSARYMCSGREGECEIQVFVYDQSGTPLIAQNAGLRISGATSRNAIRKSFRVIARKEYDKQHPKFTYDLWNGRTTLDGTAKPIQEYSSFILHSIRLAMDSTGIHNSVGYSLARKAGIVDASPTTPAAVYINGKYQGAYFLMPAKTDNALAELYNIEKKEDIEVVSVFEEEKTGTQSRPEILASYLTFVDFLQNADMTDPSVIEQVEAQLDVHQCLQYYAVNLLLGNGDWLDNNLRVWRCKDNGLPYQDGKWRFFLFDLDWIGSFSDLVIMNFEQATQSADYHNILPALLKNPEYKKEFTDLIYQMEEDAFTPEVIDSVFAKEEERMHDEATYDFQSEAFTGYLMYSVNSSPLEEKDYITMDDRKILIEDFRNHLVNTPALINNCIENGF